MRFFSDDSLESATFGWGNKRRNIIHKSNLFNIYQSNEINIFLFWQPSQMQNIHNTTFKWCFLILICTNARMLYRRRTYRVHISWWAQDAIPIAFMRSIANVNVGGHIILRYTTLCTGKNQEEKSLCT